MVDLRRAAAIVGIHEHVTRYAPDKSELQIQGESVIKALADARSDQRRRGRPVHRLQQRPQQRHEPGRLPEHVPQLRRQHHRRRRVIRVPPFARPDRHRGRPDQRGRHHLQQPGPFRRRVRGNRRRRAFRPFPSWSRRRTASRNSTA